jgi:hypothetical protein
MVTFTRAVPILVYEPQAVTTLSPGMAGTVKLCVPELVLVGELVACGEVVACGDLFGRTEAVAVTEGLAAAECLCVGEVAGAGADPGASVSADVGDAPGVAAKAAPEPPEAAADTAAEGFDPLAAHAVRPAPPMTTAMITAGTRHILMLLSSGE